VKLPLSEESAGCSNHTVEATFRTSRDVDKNVEIPSATANRRRMLGKCRPIGNKEYCLQTRKKTKFCCVLCPFQCSHPSEFELHTQRKHGDVQKTMSLNSCHEVSEYSDDIIALENESVLGILSSDRSTLQSTVSCKSDPTIPSVCSADVSKNFYCNKHRSDDIPLIGSCFSSSSDGKLLCCDLCGSECGEWKEAAVHVYKSHLSALEQWRDTQVDSNVKPQLNEDSSDKTSAGGGANDQQKQLLSAAEVEVAKCDNIEHSGDVSGHSSVNSVHNIKTFVDPSAIHLSANMMKHKFTVDECKIIASSLCTLFECCNSETEVDISVGNEVDVNNSSVKIGAAKELSLITPKSHMAAAMKLISRKCKYCHRLCSTAYNCEKHEAKCFRIIPNPKSKDSTVRKIDGDNIFYCSFCGFSDSNQQVVNAHSTKPHDTNNRLRMKPQPGHDYIGSMRLETGNFQCTLCGSRQRVRSMMLMHLHRHSSLAAVPCNAHPESTPVKVTESTKERSRRFYSSSCARSCPKCFRSFSSVTSYLSHRAVCRAIQHGQRVQQQGNVCKYSYLFHFCKQASDGRWKCKLCEHYSSYRGDLYKHIRTRHNKSRNTELDARICMRKEDGLWQCKLCKQSFACHDDVHTHIAEKHSDQLTK